MEPTVTSHEIIGPNESHVHRWRVSRLKCLGISGGMIVADRVYHPDGTADHQAASWSGPGHAEIPTYCAAERAAEIASRAITCGLQKLGISSRGQLHQVLPGEQL
jgi:hypothetical protein